ncbi:MAG TPA: hypothetical protein ENI62_05255 [Gammaproteobacteria bacterium]|nr:hypothetical protein [Gammaproteobacteria bacterium]
MTEYDDFTAADLAQVRAVLQARYHEVTEVHLADSEVRLDPGQQTARECPTLYWKARQCHYVVMKTAENEFRCQFFYDPGDQYGTGIVRYDDLLACVTDLLKVQSDHERAREGAKSGITGADLKLNTGYRGAEEDE